MAAQSLTAFIIMMLYFPCSQIVEARDLSGRFTEQENANS